MPAGKTFWSSITAHVARALQRLKATGAKTQRESLMETHAISTLLHSGTQISDEPTTEKRTSEEELIERLDQAAIQFTRIMLDNRRNEESGEYVVDLDTRMDIFKMVRDWVATRRRTDITDPNKEDGAGVLESKMALDVLAREATKRAAPDIELDKDGLPKRGKGRPTQAQLALRKEAAEAQRIIRERVERSDDSALQAALRIAKGQTVTA